MISRLRPALALVACLTLTACQNAIDLSITGGPERPVIAIASGMHLSTSKPCVTDIRVLRGSEMRDVVWSVKSADRKCPRLRSASYGETPPGFEVLKPAQPLKAGEVYEVVVTGYGWIGSQRVVWRDGRYQPLGA